MYKRTPTNEEIQLYIMASSIYLRKGGTMVFVDEIETGQISDFSCVSHKLLLFVVIVLYSRNTSFPPNPYSRVSKNSSSVSKLETWSLLLETWASKIDFRFAKTSRIENWVSSRDCQLTFARYCNVTIKHWSFVLSSNHSCYASDKIPQW